MTIINLKGKEPGPMGTFKGGRELILDICWKSEDEFITVGPKHFKVWNAGKFPPKGR